MEMLTLDIERLEERIAPSLLSVGLWVDIDIFGCEKDKDRCETEKNDCEKDKHPYDENPYNPA